MAAQLNQQADQHYMSEVLRTCVAEDFHERILLGALGLAGEAGEVVDLVKKMHFQGHTIDTEQVKDELGDVMWYIALLCHSLGLSLEDILQANVAKMHRRYPNGFEVERSINR
jgi:pentatricopeptide repeat protein